jgi:hypothetical protein
VLSTFTPIVHADNTDPRHLARAKIAKRAHNDSEKRRDKIRPNDFREAGTELSVRPPPAVMVGERGGKYKWTLHPLLVAVLHCMVANASVR